MHRGELILGFKLKCPLPGCSFESQGETKEELIAKGLEHAKTHGVTVPSPDLVAKVQAAIKQT